MQRKNISSGSEFEKDIGYSRAVVDGKWIFVSGTTGFNYASGEISDDVVEQAAQCISNIQSAMEQGGFSLADTVRVHYYFRDAADFKPCWPLLRETFGKASPAATMTTANMSDPRMKVEIEVTGRRRAD